MGVRLGGAPPGRGRSPRDPGDAPPRRRRRPAGAGDERRALPGAGGRVPGRRARVHARARPARVAPRLAAERRGLPEGRPADARAVRRAPRALRRRGRPGRGVRRRPRHRDRPLSGLPDPAREERRLGPRRALPAGDGGPRGATDAGSRRPAEPRALDDPDDGLRGVLPDGRRHRDRRPGDGHPHRLPRVRRRVARLLPDPHLGRRPGPPRPAVRAIHQPGTR